MGWCEADFKTDLNYFYIKNEQINSGVAIQTHPSQIPQLQSVDGALSGHGHGQGLPDPSSVHPAAAPQLLCTQTTAACEHEDSTACSSILYLEFGT